MFARAMTLTAAVGLLALSGCGPAKLDETKTWGLEPGDARSIDLNPQAKPQTLTVEFDSTASPVYVHVFKAADVPKDDDLTAAPENKSLASKTGEKSGTFTVQVPENTGTRVVVRGATQKTEVKLHVTNTKK